MHAPSDATPGFWLTPLMSPVMRLLCGVVMLA
jgi:hypothetical protein